MQTHLWDGFSYGRGSLHGCRLADTLMADRRSRTIASRRLDHRGSFIPATMDANWPEKTGLLMYEKGDMRRGLGTIGQRPIAVRFTIGMNRRRGISQRIRSSHDCRIRLKLKEKERKKAARRDMLLGGLYVRERCIN